MLQPFSIAVGIASLGVVAIYPLMKRITSWPQAVLGLAFSWGAFMGWSGAFGSLGWPAFALYASAVCWTIGYDTIYAQQDARDDAIVGIRSTARLFGTNARLAVGLFYAAAAAFALLALAGVGRRSCRPTWLGGLCRPSRLAGRSAWTGKPRDGAQTVPLEQGCGAVVVCWHGARGLARPAPEPQPGDAAGASAGL